MLHIVPCGLKRFTSLRVPSLPNPFQQSSRSVTIGPSEVHSCTVVTLDEKSVWGLLTLPLQGCWESSDEHHRCAGSLQALQRSPCLEFPGETRQFTPNTCWWTKDSCQCFCNQQQVKRPRQCRWEAITLSICGHSASSEFCLLYNYWVKFCIFCQFFTNAFHKPHILALWLLSRFYVVKEL